MNKRVKNALEIMKDCKPHCMECLSIEIQDKTDSGNHLWKQFEDEGFKLKKPNNKNSSWREYCFKCDRSTSHRQLLNAQPIYQQKGNLKRAVFTKEDKKRVWELWDKKCPIFGNTIAHYGDIEIDHRSPAKNLVEQEIPLKNLSDKEIKDKYMPLYKHTNQIKRNKCSTCLQTKQRPPGPSNINFWFEGDKFYNENIGCNGCFWAYPEEWGNKLNLFFKNKEIDINIIKK